MKTNNRYFLCSVIFMLLTSAFNGNAQEYVKGEILLQFKDRTQSNQLNNLKVRQPSLPQIDSLNRKYNLVTVEKIGGRQMNKTFLFRFNSKTALSELINSYQSTDLFTFVEPNYLCAPGQDSSSSIIPNDTYFNLQWYHLNNKGPDIASHLAWSIEQGDSNIVLAVLDAGLKLDHPEFSGRIWKNPNESINGQDDDNNTYVDDHLGWDFYNNDNDPTDDEGHGTKVTGAIAANANNNFFYAGVDWNCKIMPLKVNSFSGFVPHSAVINAIYYAANEGADVINMSFGGIHYSTAMKQAIEYADSIAVVQVACMMNENTTTPYYPAAYSETIAVGASNKNDKRVVPNNTTITWGSNYGAHIDVVAPGVQIYTLSHTSNNYLYLLGQGTSMSSGIVSGLCALILAQDSSRTPQQVRQILHSSAEDQVGDPLEDTPGFDQYYGYGRINAYQALSALQGRESVNSAQYIPELYPNPANQYLNVKFNENISQLKIYNLKGQVVTQKNTKKHLKEVRISLEEINPGIYFLSLLGERGKVIGSQKFIKK